MKSNNSLFKSKSLSSIARGIEVRLFSDPVNVIVPEKLPEKENIKIASLLMDMLANGDYTIDYRVRDAETAIEEYLQLHNRKLFLLSHGRIALLLALEALGIGDHPEKNEVICPSFAYNAVLDALRMRRLKPVFIDIDSSMLNSDPREIKKALSPRTAAVLIVDNYGLPNNYKLMQKIICEYSSDVKLIIDSAESFGSTYYGMPIGHYGDAVILSFSFSKPLHCGKGGGLIISNDRAEKMLLDKDLEKSVWCKGCQLDPFRAFALCLSLKNTNRNISHRNKIAELYKKELSQIAGLSFQKIPSWATSVHTHFPIIINEASFGMNRDMLKLILGGQNIYSKEYFKAQHSLYNSIEIGQLGNTNRIVDGVLALPIGSGISVEQSRKISQTIRWIHENNRNLLMIYALKWPQHAFSFLEKREIEQAEQLFKITSDAFKYLKCIAWQKVYDKILTAVKNKNVKSDVNKLMIHLKNIEVAHALKIGRNPAWVSNISAQIACADKIIRLAMHNLQKGYNKNALKLYLLSAEKYKTAGYKEKAEIYATLAKTLEYCMIHKIDKKPIRTTPIMKHDAVLIVGANGFLGKRLIAYLLEKGYTNIIGVGISALSVSNLRSFIDCDDALPDSIIRRIKYYNADIRKPGALKDVLSTRNFKSIINLTPFSDTTFFNSEPNFNIQSMLGEGFRSIINYSHVNNILLIQMSTAILYKGAQNKLNNENSEIDPFQNSYTEAKRVMELVSMNSGVKTVIFRCANMYGEGDKPKKVVPLFIKKAKQGLVLFASNDVKEFIHVEDVADAIERVLCRKIPTGITNLGSGEKISIRNLAEKIKDFANTPKNIIKSHVILSDKSGFMKVMDSSMFRECSGWQSQKSLDDGLKKLVSKF